MVPLVLDEGDAGLTLGDGSLFEDMDKGESEGRCGGTIEKMAKHT